MIKTHQSDPTELPRRFLRHPNSPTKPDPTSRSVPGSGATAMPDTVELKNVPFENVPLMIPEPITGASLVW